MDLFQKERVERQNVLDDEDEDEDEDESEDEDENENEDEEEEEAEDEMGLDQCSRDRVSGWTKQPKLAKLSDNAQ